MKKIFALSSVILLSLFLVACSSKPDQSDGEKVKIRLLTRNAGTTDQTKIWNEILNDFKNDYPDVDVIDESVGDEDSYNNKLKTGRASGDLPNIYRINGMATFNEYIDNNLLMNLEDSLNEDSVWKDGFVQSTLEKYRIPGYEGIYGVPMESGLIGVYYNTKLFEKAGIKEFPTTWDDFKSVITDLNKHNITPMALGAKSSFRAGHLHNLIFYRWLGTDASKDLGMHKTNWTDPDVIQTLKYIEDLRDLGAWDKNAIGISGDSALSEFLEGNAAMMVTGPWDVESFTNPDMTDYYEDFKVAKFPYFTEKPEFKDDDMQVISPYVVNKNLDGKEKEYTLELLKRLTNANAGKKYEEGSTIIFPRTDFEIDLTKVSQLQADTMELSKTSERIAVDIFDYDPLQSMIDRTRNSIVSIVGGGSAEDAAKEIQTEIDNNK